MGARQEIAPDQLLHNRPGGIIEEHHMIAIPTHPAADMQKNFRDVKEYGGNFIRKVFRGMKVARIKAI